MARMNLTPQRVFDIAAELADAEGYDAVTISAVARSAGVQPASLYSHVRDRDALLAGLHRLALADLAARIAPAVAGRAEHAALAALATAHREQAATRPGLWEALHRVASPETAASPEAGQVAELVLAVVRGYRISDAELVNATRFLAATLSGFLALTRAESFAHRDDSLDASWAATIAALDRALHTWPTSSTSSRHTDEGTQQ